MVDIVLLVLLVLFFGLQQRSRPQLYFRFWFAGWLLVLVSFLNWPLHPAWQHLAAAQGLIGLDAMYLGGLAFLLSLLAEDAHAQTVRAALAVSVPACILLNISSKPSVSFWLLFLLIVALQAAFFYLIFALVPASWKLRRVTLGVLALAGGCMMCIVAGSESPVHLQEWMNAQIFISAGIVFSGTGERRSLDRLVGTLGFTAWGLSSFTSLLFVHDPAILQTVLQLWNLPKYAVGFAMTLRMFDGARHDVIHLAQRYKDLYGDFRLLYEHHPMPMWIYNPASGRFLSANAAASRSYGYTQQEFLGMSVAEILAPPEELAPTQTEHTAALDLVYPWEFGPDSEKARDSVEDNQVRHRRKDRSTLAVELTEHDILFQGREARFVLAVDVTERDKLNQELFHRAQHDALTGLPNRLLLDDRIQQCLLRSSRENKKAVMFTMDIDRFKLINDTYGHPVGDECLKSIADRLRSRIRSVDTIARTGGEEFTAIIGGLNNAEDAEKIASMFLRLFDTPLTLPGQDLKVSLSIGGAVYPDDAADADGLLRKSDQALYHAKRFGRNRFAFASPEVCASFDQAMAVEAALREALRSDGFELAFLPTYDCDGCALHFEALLRMKPGANLFGPGLFIPVAEESGLIVPLGRWVVVQACRQLLQWRTMGNDPITIGINVSGRQLLQKGFGAFVLETLRDHLLPPSALRLELTETSLMTEPALMREAMMELADEGIRFAIDDFGTGYSSLARLADLPIAQLKIDRSFVSQLDQAKRGDGIVTAIVHMAQTLHVEIVAEGVETESQLNVLLRRGCDHFQGFYLSTPLSSGDVSVLLEQRNPLLLAHPLFSQSRVAVSKRVRRSQLPALAAAGRGAE